VVTNAGTVLLDSLINDRPVVCVVYDEGGSVENDLAGKNVTGHHYRDLMQSNAFIVARSLAEVMEGVQRCLSHPEERGGERRAIVERVVGSMDGKAGQRVIQEMMRSLNEDPAE
jgi:CDP-glycerol glycerophosphotransferase (TagB/SpsB family)